MKKIIATIMSLAVLAGCASPSQPKSLVLYYSQYGATKTVAEDLAAQTGADIEAFDVEEPYDGTFDQTVSRCLDERSRNYLPKVSPISSDLSAYDVIYLGFPVWFGVAAVPVFSLIGEYDLSGKTIIPFCTFGSGGTEACTEDLRQRIPDADIRDGYGVRNARIGKCHDEITKFLIACGAIEGEIEVLPEFSAQTPVTEEESAVFDAACSNYQMPLGTPATVGSREVEGGVEYLFTVISDPSGATSSIYVLAPEGEAPEFTRVVR